MSRHEHDFIHCVLMCKHAGTNFAHLGLACLKWDTNSIDRILQSCPTVEGLFGPHPCDPYDVMELMVLNVRRLNFGVFARLIAFGMPMGRHPIHPLTSLYKTALSVNERNLAALFMAAEDRYTPNDDEYMNAIIAWEVTGVRRFLRQPG